MGDEGREIERERGRRSRSHHVRIWKWEWIFGKKKKKPSSLLDFVIYFSQSLTIGKLRL